MNEAGNCVPARSALPPQYTWATEDLYPSDRAWLEDMEAAKTMAADIGKFSGTLAESAENLLAYLQSRDALTVKYDLIFNYAERKTHEDTRLALYQDFYNQAQGLSAIINSATAFAVPEILQIPQQTLDGFYAQCPDLCVYRRYIHEKRRRKAHILSEKEERLLAAAQTLANAPTTIMATFTNADLKYPDVIGEDGKPTPLTGSRYLGFLQSKDVNVRRDAFEKLNRTLARYENTSAAMYNAQANQLLFYAQAKNYGSSLERSLDEADVPVSVYHNLIDAVHGNLHHMHKYMALRKKLLKLQEQHSYDLSVPLVPQAECKVPYEQAKQDVLEAVAPLGKQYQDIMRQGFENRWIDVYENEGKFGGAYSAGANIHPFVMLNYKDTLKDEFILAHEMGHAIHSYLSYKHQPVVYSEYAIFVAEVASTCNEALLMEYLLGKTQDKLERASLINYFLEQFRGTLFRQAMLAEFELRSHELVQQGSTLTAQSLNSLYYDLNRAYYGPEVVLDPEVAVEWSKIPHFYYNFYVYQYATGYSAAMALSRKILDEGQSAVEKYLQFLSGGSSASPIDLLKIAGVDMTTPEPINAALQVFGKLIDELDALLAEP